MTEQYQQDPFAAAPESNSGNALPQTPPVAYPASGAYVSAPAGFGGGPMPMYVGPSPTEKNWMGITALVLSLAFIVAGVLASVPAVVFGHLGLSAVKKGEADNRGLALAGLIIGYVGIGLTVIGVVAYIVFIGWMISEGGDGMYLGA